MFRLISRQRANYLSRDRAFLIRASAWIMAVSVACAVLTWAVAGRGNSNSFAAAARAAAGDPERMVELVREAPMLIALDLLNRNPDWSFGPPRTDDTAPKPTLQPVIETLLQILETSKLDAAQTSLIRSYALAVHGIQADVRDAAFDELQAKFDESTTVPLANEILGDLLLARVQPDAAVKRYQAELRLRDSRRAADQLLGLAADERRGLSLQQLLADPAVRRSASVDQILDACIERRDIAGVFRGTLAVSWARYSPAHTGLGIFVAAVWFIIVGQLAGFRRSQLALYGVAVLLGIFSAIITLFAAILQNNVYGVMTDSDELVAGLIYYIAGVGLREESIKLLFFLPLIPWLLRRVSEMEVLVVAAMVGLGFALEENLGYYARGGSPIGRFLTANFAHMALTGLAGHACFRMIRYPRSCSEQFLATFLLMIIAHGLYDAVISLPDLNEVSIAGIIIFAVLSYRYFSVAGELRMTGSHQISPLGLFVIGTALIVGVSLNVVCFGMPPHPAYIQFAVSVAPILPVAFVFINQFRNA